MAAGSDFQMRISNRAVTTWVGLTLLKRMLKEICFHTAALSRDLLQAGSIHGYPLIQIVEQFIVCIWCGANRFAHTGISRFDKSLTCLFEWKYVAGHKSIVRLSPNFIWHAFIMRLSPNFIWHATRMCKPKSIVGYWTTSGSIGLRWTWTVPS